MFATLDLARRIQDPELMDSGNVGEEEIASSLRFLGIAHRHFGGESLIRGYLEKWRSRWPKDGIITFLDVGTGGADVPVSLARRDEKRRFQIAGLDSDPAIARIARKNAEKYSAIRIIKDDFFSFAKRGARFDYVLASLFLHHMPHDRLIETLQACDAMAKRGIIISDLLRSRNAWWGIRLATLAFGNRVSRYDGPLSVRRAFTTQELDDLARRAGLDYLSSRRHPFFRVSLAGEKEV
jgi:2-polyprenyl-3-methyl-5-hydroxy-6-metoxy-1,4-benzoquinol methylase